MIYILCRKRSTHKDIGNNKNIAVSANMVYGEVTLKSTGMEGEYENPNKILKPSDQWNETAASIYENNDISNSQQWSSHASI